MWISLFIYTEERAQARCPPLIPAIPQEPPLYRLGTERQRKQELCAQDRRDPGQRLLENIVATILAEVHSDVDSTLSRWVMLQMHTKNGTAFFENRIRALARDAHQAAPAVVRKYRSVKRPLDYPGSESGQGLDPSPGEEKKGSLQSNSIICNKCLRINEKNLYRSWEFWNQLAVVILDQTCNNWLSSELFDPRCQSHFWTRLLLHVASLMSKWLANQFDGLGDGVDWCVLATSVYSNIKPSLALFYFTTTSLEYEDIFII